MEVIYIFCTLVLLSAPNAVVESQNICYSQCEYGDLFGGDVMLNAAQKIMLFDDYSKRKKRSAHEFKQSQYWWPNGTVTYRISSKFETYQRNEIIKAMQHISTQTCVKFNEAHQDDTKFVNIRLGISCSSEIGYQGKEQNLYLSNQQVGTRCLPFGSIVHELLHTLGFYHQQCSANRDDYIKVLYENVYKNKSVNFKKQTAFYSTDFDVGYDYNSIMHYEKYAYSKNSKPTIEPLDPNAVIGQRDGLSAKDIQKINRMYNCNK